MAIEITHLRFADPAQPAHDSVVAYKWRNPESGATGDRERPAMITWVEFDKNFAYVGRGADRVWLAPVYPDDGEPYLRAQTDGAWLDDLLGLPTY